MRDPLGVALVCVLDGLQSLRRGEADLLELLPGSSAAISGPIAVRNPVTSDVQAKFLPEESPLTFELEGFFTGYVFGSGMWRGRVCADESANPGRYALRVAFRGLPANAVQRFPVRVYADASAMQEASLSFICRYLGMNPFWLAAGCCVAGLLVGLVVFFMGHRRLQQLAALRCGEVVMVRREAQGLCVWCLLYDLRAPATGTCCTVLDMRGTVLGQARVNGVRKGTLEMFMSGHSNVSAGCLVLLPSPCHGHRLS